MPQNNDLRSRLAALLAELQALLGQLQPPDTTPPIVNLTASSTAFTAPGTLNLQATAAGGTIARVEFYQNGAKIGEQFTPTNGVYKLPVEVKTSAQAGTYTAKAFTLAAASAPSAPLGVTVDIAPPVIVPPTVALTASALSFTAAGTLNLTAIASAPLGIKELVFYWGSIAPANVIATDSAAPYAASRPIALTDNGITTVYVVATDNTTPTPLTAQDSLQVSVNIAPPVELPTLSVTPTSAVTGATLTATLGRLQAGDQLDWGDGTVVEAVNGLSHSYSASGPYTVSVLRGGAAAVSVPVTISTPVIGITWEGPKTITEGGTYTGNWQSVDDPLIPAVTINTTAPVIFDGGNIRGRGDLFRCRKTGAAVTIRNFAGEGLNPNVAGKPQGRFADLQGLVAALVENNEFTGTGGIYFKGYVGNGTTQTFIIRRNFGRNINGQYSDGAGGYKTGASDFYRVQLVQLNQVHAIPGARIEWNRTLNEPRKSHIEDTINLSDTDGKSNADRIIIQKNLIEGAYAWNPAATYSGGGIMMGDGVQGRYVEARYNTVLETSNYGIAAAGGNDIGILNNVILGIGKLADGTLLDADSDAGIYVRNYNSASVRDPATVLVDGNTVGWGTPTSTNPNSRYDISCGPTLGTLGTNTLKPAGPITQAMLDAARQAWLADLAAQSFVVGRTV